VAPLVTRSSSRWSSTRSRELEARSGRVTDRLAPGQVILKLARDGFGVLLEDASASEHGVVG
jgi:hypothetical protein